MGLFNFVKNAGSKLFGNRGAPVPAADAADAPKAEAPVYTQEQEDSMKADELLAEISRLGFKVDSLFVAVEDDVATVSGEVDNMAEKEKVILTAGNVEGIAAVDDQIKIEVEEPASVFHTVVGGDSLSKISKQYYGSYNKYMVIFEANQPMLKSPDVIYPGQVLRIPAMEADA